MHYDSRVSSGDGTLGRRRLLCSLGGKFSRFVVRCGWPENFGRRVNQFGTSMGSASRNSKKAGKVCEVRKVNDL